MPAFVPDRPAMLPLQATQAGRPVSHRHGRAWQDSLHFLLGHNMPVVCSTDVPRQPTATSADYYFAYKRSPGARALLVLVELHEPAAEGATCTVTAARATGLTSYLPDGSSGDLRGAIQLQPQYGLWSDQEQFVDVIDVSGLTVGTLEWIKVTWANSAGTTHGVSKIHAIEVPRRSIAEDSSDAGVDASWPFTGNYLWDGSSATMDGFVRMLAEIDRARTEWRTWLQVATVEANADAWTPGASVGVFAAVTFGRSAQPSLFTRARRLYTTGTNNAKKFVCRYRTGHATAGAQLKMTATSYTTGTIVTTTFTLPASVGWTSFAETAAAIPCDGVDQEVSLKFDFKTDAGASLQLSTLALYDAET